ncbi:MAG: hypothetical protein F6J94_29895 [Moorea sp. SIO1F2]|uniref:hypothetical protein n=1 Tax=Moorena sp. SIO1F2 TaxID=2607819 RepID=UPI0013B93019|nr:hypothetical protein [Moorena sp. SIO1F2]NET85949.1 hypothetical protein [Moorena sp. SIO1F2]
MIRRARNHFIGRQGWDSPSGNIDNRQDAGSTKMPVPPICRFHQDARSTKMLLPPRCRFQPPGQTAF